jgi:two-component system nitrogen regulation response regulator GlnG
MPTSRVLLVDDAPEVHVVIADILRKDAVEVDAVADGEAALQRAEAVVPTVVLLDIKLPGQSGIEVLPRLRERLPTGTPIIMLTACGDVDTAIHAIRLGAYDYVIKPFAHEDLRERVMRAVEQQTMRDELDGRRIGVGAGDLREQMGRSPHILRIIGHVQRVAVSNFTVLVQGETGTGKELVARAIHQNSPRRAQPFVALDCGAIPETLIESELFGYERGAFTGADRHKDGHFHLAEGGTLFLDEIVNLPPTTQVKLLRVLEERRVWALGSKKSVPVDVRIIAACNVDMETEVRAGRFRADLFYRLNEFSVNLPPLRERREDIARLAKRFLAEAAIELKRTVYGFTPEAEAFLVGQPWPGNVRELRNVVRRAVLSAPTMIDLCHFAPLESPHAAGLLPLDGEATAATLAAAREQAVVKAESEAIRAALIATGGNKAAAARLLKVDYKTLWYKLKEYGIRTFHAA